MIEETKLLDWQAPPRDALPAVVQDFTEQCVQEGENWWKSQPGSNSETLLDLLSCKGSEYLKSNNIKADVRKFVETISDIREIATYGSGADQFKEEVDAFNRAAKYVYRASHFPVQTRQTLQYSVGLSRGYMVPRYRRSEFGWGPGEVEFMALGPREMLPCQVPRNNDVQGAYVQTIVECVGIAEAHARFPKFQDKLLPISKFKYSSNNQVRRHEFWDRKYGKENQNWDQRYCEIRYTIIRDLSINRTGKMIPMGDSGSSWYYEVPSVGSVISWLDPYNGLPASRKATVADSRMYPMLRLMITNPGMAEPMYDGTNFDWHGIMPAVQYDVDDWPWLAVGYSLLSDIASMEKFERGFVDIMGRVLRAKMNPIKGYDLDAGIPREDLKRLDWLDPDAPTIGVSGDPTKALRSLLPESVRVDAEDFKFVEMMEKMRQKTLGLNDLGSLAQLKFNLSSETADKMLETIGPIAKGIAANMEIAQAKIAHMLKFIILQYFTTRKLMSAIGPDAISLKTFDQQPDSLVPSHMPWETDNGKDSQVSKIDRAKWFAQNLDVVSVPSQLLNVTQMQEKMMWLNFLERGLPVSFSTAFKKLGVENWGETPGATEFDKWKSEQYAMLDLKIKQSQVAALEMPGVAPNGQGKGGGRPPSGKRPPKLETRGNNSGKPRTVVAQSN